MAFVDDVLCQAQRFITSRAGYLIIAVIVISIIILVVILVAVEIILQRTQILVNSIELIRQLFVICLDIRQCQRNIIQQINNRIDYLNLFLVRIQLKPLGQAADVSYFLCIGHNDAPFSH